VAAYGAFIAPVVIGGQIKAGTPENAMYGFAVFYAVCLILNWWFYLRSGAEIKNRKGLYVGRVGDSRPQMMAGYGLRTENPEPKV